MNMTVALQLVARIIVLCIAFPVHESAHAIIANKLGDPTARRLGRIDLNPFAHMKILPAMGMILLATLMDIYTQSASAGNLILLITSIFFFKPVPIDPRYFKNPKGGMALTALAGPMSNIIIGFFSLIIYKLVYYLAPQGDFVAAIVSLMGMVVSINLQLAAFNLLPIPPMDGFKILSFFLPNSVIYKFEQYSTYIMLGVVVLLYATPVLDVFINFGYGVLFKLINFLTGFIELIVGF